MRLAAAGGAGGEARVRGEYASSAAMSMALHAALAVAIVFAPQIFKGRKVVLPDLGPIYATIEGTGGPPAGGGGMTRPVAAPPPPAPAPPVKVAPAPPAPAPPVKAAPAPPAPAADLALPRPDKARPVKPVAKADDLRPDFPRPPTRRTAPPGPLPPAPVGPVTAATAPGPIASVPGPGGAGVDVGRKGPGGSGGEGTGTDPLHYYYALIQDKVSGFWAPQARAEREEMRVLLGIRLVPSGEVRDITIEESSGDRAFDNAAIRALRQAGRMPPFPPLVRENHMDLILKFTDKGMGG